MNHNRTFHEDWLLIAIGAIALTTFAFLVRLETDGIEAKAKPKVVNQAKGWFPKLEDWDRDPARAFFAKPKSGEPYFWTFDRRYLPRRRSYDSADRNL